MNKMDLENQKVLVAGLGKSGMAAYELLKIWAQGQFI